MSYITLYLLANSPQFLVRVPSSRDLVLSCTEVFRMKIILEFYFKLHTHNHKYTSIVLTHTHAPNSINRIEFEALRVIWTVSNDPEAVCVQGYNHRHLTAI